MRLPKTHVGGSLLELHPFILVCYMDVYLVFQLSKNSSGPDAITDFQRPYGYNSSIIGISLSEYEFFFHLSQTFTEQSVWHGLVPSSLYQAIED